MNALESINRHIFLTLNADGATSPMAIQLATVIADALVYGLPLALVALWLWGGDRQRQAAVQAAIVACVALGINQWIASVWPHPRPFVDGIGHQWLAHAPDPSFPSDHMTVFSSIGLTLLAGGSSVTGTAVMVSALAVAWARIFLGVHYPLDMVGGLLVSILSLALSHPLWKRAAPPSLQILHVIYRRLFAWPIAKGWTRS